MKNTTDQTIEALKKQVEESNNDDTVNDYFDQLIEENRHLSQKIENYERNQKNNVPRYASQYNREQDFESI